MMINFIVCDDDIYLIKHVKDVINSVLFKTNMNYKIYTYINYDKDFDIAMTSNLINKIYILDIEVNDKSGIDISQEIRKNDWESSIIMLTSHTELELFALKSRILLIDFISKFDNYDDRLSSTIMLCVNNKLSGNCLMVKNQKKNIFIPFKDILYITYDVNIRKSIIVTKKEEIKSIESLKAIYKRLQGIFLFSHKACIVNVNNIKEVDISTHTIHFVKGKSTDLLSRNHYKEFKYYGHKNN